MLAATLALSFAGGGSSLYAWNVSRASSPKDDLDSSFVMVQSEAELSSLQHSLPVVRISASPPEPEGGTSIFSSWNTGERSGKGYFAIQTWDGIIIKNPPRVVELSKSGDGLVIPIAECDNYNTAYSFLQMLSEYEVSDSFVSLFYCKVFGYSIEQLLHREKQMTPTITTETNSIRIPRIVHHTLKYLAQPGNIVFQGLFRISGETEKIGKLITEIDNGVYKFTDICTTTSMLKRFFGQLPSSLIPLNDPYFGEYCLAREPSPGLALAVKEVVERIPKSHAVVLEVFVDFLNIVAAFQEINLMKRANLAIVLGPTLIPTPILQYYDLGRVTLLCMMEYYDTIFSEIPRADRPWEGLNLVPQLLPPPPPPDLPPPDLPPCIGECLPPHDLPPEVPGISEGSEQQECHSPPPDLPPDFREEVENLLHLPPLDLPPELPLDFSPSAETCGSLPPLDLPPDLPGGGSGLESCLSLPPLDLPPTCPLGVIESGNKTCSSALPPPDLPPDFLPPTKLDDDLSVVSVEESVSRQPPSDAPPLVDEELVSHQPPSDVSPLVDEEFSHQPPSDVPLVDEEGGGGLPLQTD